MKKSSLFIVPQNQEGFNVIQKLDEGKFIKNKMVFDLFKNTFLLHITIEPGGYQLNNNMWAWDILNKLNGKPDLAWVRFGGCLRKEQIGEILKSALGWSDEELNKWNTHYTNTKPEYFEGVYYPDTYLIPVNESGDKVAQRLINRFNEKFAPLADKYIQANIRWVTGLKIASLIAREAAGKTDMHLISGIIWNRLDVGMPLQIDSTMQYTLGKNSEGKWWGSIDIGEKQNDSLYNSYLYKGLPPTPICSPNIDYIEAALNPEETDCLFYLHDSKQQIHCAKTYEEHLKNIDIYLN
ncbi:MAG: endolytic transglycosylase MltG [Candidatus Roizmanbacteria bacterium]|nr:endolytic transglycosylase MltG [Candidatus Roizmanbacteria bacterium]